MLYTERRITNPAVSVFRLCAYYAMGGVNDAEYSKYFRWVVRVLKEAEVNMDKMKAFGNVKK